MALQCASLCTALSTVTTFPNRREFIYIFIRCLWLLSIFEIHSSDGMKLWNRLIAPCAWAFKVDKIDRKYLSRISPHNWFLSCTKMDFKPVNANLIKSVIFKCVCVGTISKLNSVQLINAVKSTTILCTYRNPFCIYASTNNRAMNNEHGILNFMFLQHGAWTSSDKFNSFVHVSCPIKLFQMRCLQIVLHTNINAFSL